MRSLCLLFALAVLAVMPVWSEAPGGEILIDDQSGGEIACGITCTSNQYCSNLCGCNAVCQYFSYCGRYVCNCTMCP